MEREKRHMQNKNNQLIEYKPSIFYKLKELLKKIFFRKKSLEKEEIKANVISSKSSEDFKEAIVVKQDKEKQRLLDLKLKYDNDIISIKDISEKDIDLLVELYNEETEELNRDTIYRKDNIRKMLDELN